jgi:hypothetical protein
MSKPKTPATETTTAPIDAALATLDAIETEHLATVTGGFGDGSPAGRGQLGFAPHQMRN